MSAPGSPPPPYREIAERTLSQAAAVMNALPKGPIPVTDAQINAAQAQALAAIAAAQALIEIGDVLRAAFQEQADG